MSEDSEINGYTVVGRVPQFAVLPSAFSPDDQLELLLLRGEQAQRLVDGKTPDPKKLASFFYERNITDNPANALDLADEDIVALQIAFARLSDPCPENSWLKWAQRAMASSAANSGPAR